MQNIKQVISENELTTFRGSETTRALVEKQIVKRWGKEEAKNFDPYRSVRSFSSWLNLNFRVKKGEKALKSFTIVESRDEKGNAMKIKRTCSLFYYLQVEPAEKAS